MEAHAQAELASRLCLSGPHKDDLAVEINGREARVFSSQGQTRTAALALKLAEREILKNALGEYPVLLLDDVLSELDPRRQEFVLNRIAGGQVFITCCEDDRLTRMLGGKVLHVSGGVLE
jgi:DNA replication and repair protein RecF